MNAPVIAARRDGDLDAFAEVVPLLGDRQCGSNRPLSSRTYLIAMLPRTGSTALCSLLSKTGVLGHPAEYLNPRGPVQYWAEVHAARNVIEYLDVLRREQATDNGVFGLKTTFADLTPLLQTGSLAALLGDDLCFVYLTRQDILRQAISEYLAEQSGVWHRDAAGEPLNSNPVGVAEDVPFDEEKILEIVDRLLAMQLAWERFFVLYGAKPLRITYESWCADAGGTVERIAEHVGVRWYGSTSLGDATTSKLADGRTDSWVREIRRRFPL